MCYHNTKYPFELPLCITSLCVTTTQKTIVLSPHKQTIRVITTHSIRLCYNYKNYQFLILLHKTYILSTITKTDPITLPQHRTSFLLPLHKQSHRFTTKKISFFFAIYKLTFCVTNRQKSLCLTTAHSIQFFYHYSNHLFVLRLHRTSFLLPLQNTSLCATNK